MKKRFDAVEKNKQLILDTLDFVWKNPETGYREVKTSKYMADAFRALGYELTMAEGITGFYTIIDTGRPGPELLIMGELDSLICADHPESDPETGAVHCCGHAAQCAALIGIAAALKEPGVLDGLSGRIRLCAVPAEELIEIEYRTKLKKEGKIKYFGGKPEFLYRGYFDGVDLAFMVHTTTGENFSILQGNVGCIAKKITYKGKSAHAGGAPQNGCNALYAATQGLSAVNAIRETFREPDMIRFHPIITKGGNAVNAIPDEVIVESYVRGNSFDAMREVNKRVNRALIGGALSLGANVEIEDTPGYAPVKHCAKMIQLAEDAAAFMPEIPCRTWNTYSTGSTDMGDLCCVMPIIHPSAPGAVGIPHGADYYIANPDLACVASAKWQVAMLTLLLQDGAKRAQEIVDTYEAPFKSKAEYFAYVDAIMDEGNRISYEEDQAIIRL